VTCPECKKQFTPEAGQQLLLQPQVVPQPRPEPEPAPLSEVESSRWAWMQPKRREQIDAQPDLQPVTMAQQSVLHVHMAAPVEQLSNPLAIASLVLGIIGALGCWIPVLGCAAIPVGILGGFLGCVALAMVAFGGRPGGVVSLVGLALCAVSVAVPLLFIGVVASKVSELPSRADRNKETAPPEIKAAHKELAKPIAAAPVSAETQVSAETGVSAAPREFVRVGDVVVVGTVGGGMNTLALDDRGWRQMLDAQNARNQEWLVDLARAGHIFGVPGGTRARIIEAGFSSKRLHILEGPTAGFEGWIQSEMLSHPSVPAVAAPVIADRPRAPSPKKAIVPEPETDARRAKRLLREGDAFAYLSHVGDSEVEKSRQRDKALDRYKQVIREFPDAPEAIEARRRIDAMGRPTPL
jgi:hypothetical protein